MSEDIMTKFVCDYCSSELSTKHTHSEHLKKCIVKMFVETTDFSVYYLVNKQYKEEVGKFFLELSIRHNNNILINKLIKKNFLNEENIRSLVLDYHRQKNSQVLKFLSSADIDVLDIIYSSQTRDTNGVNNSNQVSETKYINEANVMSIPRGKNKTTTIEEDVSFESDEDQIEISSNSEDDKCWIEEIEEDERCGIKQITKIEKYQKEEFKCPITEVDLGINKKRSTDICIDRTKDKEDRFIYKHDDDTYEEGGWFQREQKDFCLPKTNNVEVVSTRKISSTAELWDQERKLTDMKTRMELSLSK